MQPSDTRRAARPVSGEPGPAGTASDQFIEQLVGEIGDGQEDDPRLAQVEERLTQLRELSDELPEPPDTEEPDEDVSAIVPPARPSAPPAPPSRGRPKRSPAERRPTADEVVIEAARAAGDEPVYLEEEPPVARRMRRRRRRSPVSFYLVALLLLALCGALFVLWKPALNRIEAVSDALLTIEPTPAISCDPVPPEDPVGTHAASTGLPPAPSRLPPLAVLQDASVPQQSIIYLNQRLVRTYQVDADGRIAYDVAN